MFLLIIFLVKKNCETKMLVTKIFSEKNVGDIFFVKKKYEN